MWNTNIPGATPVCVVGAGFQRAVLDPPRPSTEDIICETIRDCPDEFPALEVVGRVVSNRNLNFVWTNIYYISDMWRSLAPEVIKAYEGVSFRNTSMSYLVEHLKKQPQSGSPAWLLCLILGVELKKMLAFQYEQTKLTLKDPLPDGLVKFLAATEKRTFTWVSLNYELSLERVLEKCVDANNWRYGFKDLLDGRTKGMPGDVRHVIVKPHGSLNVWFKTVWESRSKSGKPDLHELAFVDTDRLKTCPFAEVGCVNGNEPAEELRPWVIGYLPDIMKDELTSPGFFADTAHDLCKWNMSYAGLAFQKASSLYVLGYSMPDEDRWVWERLAALRKKDFPIYVASQSDSERIKAALKAYGFSKTEILTSDGSI